MNSRFKAIRYFSFQSLDKLLLLYESSSSEIIEKYYIEKCEEQVSSHLMDQFVQELMRYTIQIKGEFIQI